MGRHQRKEDRQARKRTKITATQSHAHNTTGATAVGKQTTNAGFVFNKNQFTSLINKGKARQQPHAAAQTTRQTNAKTSAMEMDDALPDTPEPSAAAAARLRDEIAGAAASSNSHAGFDRDEQESTEAHQASFGSSRLQLDPTLTGRRDSSIKAYMRELRKVVDNADVLLQVLDARDPLGCRSLETETMLLRAGKKVVLILNKIDLVPKSNVEAWLRYLRHDFPTLAFKASTQLQRTHLSHGANAVNYAKPASSLATSGADAIAGGSEAIGAGALLQLIKNYSRSLNLKTSIAVGVFGAPNVGKSSLINSLKRARVCSVASTPGHTKVVQSVMLDKSVRLLDCPGIVFSDESASGAASLGLSQQEIQMRRQSALLRNVVKVELVQDPITPVEAIMARVQPEHLIEVYGLEWFQEGDAQDLLMRIAVQRGRMARGGKIDLEGTARSVLHDWNVGRIKYYTQPPALHRSAILSSDNKPSAGNGVNTSIGGEAAGREAEEQGVDKKLEQSSAILSGFSEAFDLAGLLGDADAEVFGAGTGQSNAPLPDAPAPRFAPLVEENKEEADALAEIEDDHAPISTPTPASVEVEQVGDTSRRSTLGKRTRLSSASPLDSDSDSDDDNEADAVPARRSIHVPGLDALEDDTLDAEPAADSGFGIPPSLTASNAWEEKLAAKATARPQDAGLAELNQMATSTGAARRKLKKMKKRADRAGAGLVGRFQGQKLDEPENDNELGKEVAGEKSRGTANGVGRGMFGTIAPKTKPNNVRLGNARTGSMFDVLLEGQNMDSSDQEQEEGEESGDVVVARNAVTVEEDIEEEL